MSYFQLARIFSLGLLLMASVACATAPSASSAPRPTSTPTSLVDISTATRTPAARPSTPSATEAPTQTDIRSALPNATAEPLLPPRLLIPKLKVNEPIIEIPIVEGEWDIGALGSRIGWLTTTGARPGEAWAMAFVGHVSLDTGISGPFGYLWRLRPGAEIVFQQGATQYVYVVTEKRAVGADAVNELYIPDGNQMVLMTCDNWDFANWHYTERLLVLAELVEQREVPIVAP